MRMSRLLKFVSYFFFIVISVISICLSLILGRKGLYSAFYQPVRRHKPIKKDFLYVDIYLESNIDSKRINWYVAEEIGKCPKRKRDKLINVWLVDEFENRPVVLYYHGNSHNISYRKYMIDICRLLHLNICLVDYRGYGKSGGEAEPNNLIEDADTTYRFLRDVCDYLPSDIVIWGESLGGSPALYTASTYQVKCLVLFSTFASLEHIIPSKYGPLGSILISSVPLLERNTNNIRFIRRVKCPVLIYHSSEDTLIPYNNALILYRNIKHNNKKLVTIKGEHHSPNINAEEFEYAPSMIIPGTNTSKNTISTIVDIIRNTLSTEYV